MHRTAHRPLCHEYLAPDRTTFSSLSSFYTVLWHITLKAIRKNSEFLTCLKHATPGQPQVIPPILQNTFRAIGHRTAHRPLCHEYLAPDRTTFSGLSSFYTVLWHITLKAICKKQYSSRASNTPPPGQPKLSFSKSPCPVKRLFLRTNTYSCRFVRRYKCFTGQTSAQSLNQIADRRTAKSDLNIETRWEPPISSS